ncbi:hypothetical protein EMIHUDRAFT_242563 [Emiliania huxleyi CCMP1516]|uniref:Uncharacterized protein n=3 Tax=Emiliania huxleyi TaxID=2903 RepID=A0A0D3J8H0_EMIH1|nr:hypothetical protein EMIHUDRAFT_242563 [Emiliania huxleyi CCMP1516]EOD19805.1 hypothetical protein EMIHUDRAFT_242563 [Emiliania huxleyi CCMP1516]|eukprot:XP_005772234.1 hypothetical protein EMIHUDRAFT_242563 [Emiliania huxleyi CCMP1516]
MSAAGPSALDDQVLRLRGTIPGAGPASAEMRQREFEFSSVPGWQINGRPVCVKARQGGRTRPSDRALWFEDGCWFSGWNEDFVKRLKAGKPFTVRNPADEFVYSTWRSEETDVMHPKDVRHWYFSDGQTWTPTTLSSEREAAAQLHRQGSKSAAAGDPPWLVSKALALASGDSDALYSELAELNKWSSQEELLNVRFGLWQKGQSTWTPLTWLCSVDGIAEAKTLAAQWRKMVELDSEDEDVLRRQLSSHQEDDSESDNLPLGVARRHATAITAAMLAAQHLRLTTATERLTTAEVAVGLALRAKVCATMSIAAGPRASTTANGAAFMTHDLHLVVAKRSPLERAGVTQITMRSHFMFA